MGGFRRVMGPQFRNAVAAAALVLTVTGVLACGGSTPEPVTAPTVAVADTPAPPSPTVAPTTAPVNTPTAVPSTHTPVPTLQPSPTPSAVSTPDATATPLPPPATAVPPTATAVPPTATAAPTSTAEPTVAPSPQVGNNIGDLAPAFTLQSARSGEYALESFRGDKNVVLVFYRAFW